jgi:hypothetical protein
MDSDDAPVPGNDSARWNLLLEALDKKFQLGLLEKLRAAKSFHFEGNTLYIECFTKADLDYFEKPTVKTQLAVFAEDAITVEQIIFK